MQREEMLSLFQQHRKAEAARDFAAIMATFVEDCYLETVPLNLRVEGRSAARAAYEGYFTAFPDLTPDDEGFAFGDDVIVTWGTLRGTSKGEFLGVPGPVIAKVTATKAAATLDLKIEGQNLHKNATISVDGQVVDVTRPASAATVVPSAVNSNLLPELTVQLDLTGPWATGDHLLRVANLDGQYAEIWFAADPPKITNVNPASIAAGTKSTTVAITGTDVRLGSSAEWLAPNATNPVAIAAANVDVKSATSAEVKNLDVGTTKGQGTLTLVSPRGLRASTQIAIT